MSPENTPNNKRIVLVDIDDTLSKTTPAYFSGVGSHVLACFRNAGSVTNWRKGPRYLVEKSLQETSFYKQLPVHKDSPEVLRDLKEKDQYDFKIATRRKPYLRNDTELWLEENYPGIFSDIFYEVEDKGKLAKELGAVGLIDNDMTHYHSGLRHGIESIRFTPYRWNLFKKPQHRKRALTWKAIGDFLENRSNE